MQTGDKIYDLIIQSDINAPYGRHNQWFFFSITGAEVNSTYKFNIINMCKSGSQFNNGMQPVVYCTSEKIWRRMGESIMYSKNHYKKEDSTGLETYYTLSFSIAFVTCGTYYVAYHYPYTYSELQRFLYQISFLPFYDMRCRRSLLCQTLAKNDCPLLTITNFDEGFSLILILASNINYPIAGRKYIYLSARVHPGESNSSHVMEGLIDYLLSDELEAYRLRDLCIFKIVPMLNPDGVINGSHRCSLAGLDLNRQWKSPSKILTPTVFNLKLLWSFLTKLNEAPVIACDFHGHSRKKNVFIFGNNTSGGADLSLPRNFALKCSMFDLKSCRFHNEKSKEPTARVVLYKDLGVQSSFTLECTYNGFDIGAQRGYQIQLKDFAKIGKDFCSAILLSVTAEKGVTEPGDIRIPNDPKSKIRKSGKIGPKVNPMAIKSCSAILSKSKRNIRISKTGMEKGKKLDSVSLEEIECPSDDSSDD